MRCCLLKATIFLFLLPLVVVAQQEFNLETLKGKEWKVRGLTQESVVDYVESGKAWATNGVLIEYGDATLTAKRMRLDQESGEVIAEGDVYLQRGKQVWTGDWVVYNFKTRQLETGRFRTGVAPLFAGGENLYFDQTNQTYVATNSFVTTDNVEEPVYRVRTKELRVVPGEYFEAKGATLFLGKVPVFYFPYYYRRLDRNANHFNFSPGYRTLYGAYLLGEYNWFYGENLSGTVHFDYRTKRGFAGGPDFGYDAGVLGKGELETYYARDEDPTEGNVSRPLDQDRYRIRFAHRAVIHTNLTAKVLVNKQSDEFVVRDFFESEFRQNIQPRSYLEIQQLWPNFTLDALVQPQLNDFFDRVEHLPDVQLNALRQKLGVSPFYYEGENSVGWYRRQFAFDNPPSYSAFRGDSYHQLLLPQTLFGWLNVTPRVGGRLTHYGNVDATGTETNAQTRGVFNTGAEISFKAWKVWEAARNEFFDINGIRHIVEPSLNYSFVPEPNRRPNELPQFDYLLPSYRLLPLEFPDFNAIDAVDSQNTIRWGLRNKWQTKRDGTIDTLAHWALYMDWRLDPRENQSTYSDLYSDLDLKPWSWLTLNSQIRYDVGEGMLEQSFHQAIFSPGDRWNWGVGHWFLEDGLEFGEGNNLITSRLYYKLNENYAFRALHFFEAQDGRLEEQQYTVYRDLRSWTMGVTFMHRESREGPDDFSVGVVFSLKAYPRFEVGEDRAKPSLLLGG